MAIPDLRKLGQPILPGFDRSMQQLRNRLPTHPSRSLLRRALEELIDSGMWYRAFGYRLAIRHDPPGQRRVGPKGPQLLNYSERMCICQVNTIQESASQERERPE